MNALKNKIQAIEESNVKGRKIKNKLIQKLVLANEDLDTLDLLDADKLISKYDQVMTLSTNSDKIELDTMKETLSEVKHKLQLQKEQNVMYERQHNEIMNILKIPKESQCFANILPAVKNLQESYSSFQEHEKIEIESYSNAQAIIQSL